MRRGSLGLSALLVGLVSLSALGHPAWADVPPPQACTSPGQPCTNAGLSANQAGVCRQATCSRTVPAPDGGTMQMTYSCMLCQLPGDGGPDSAPGAGGGTGTGTGGAMGGGTGGANASDAGTTPPKNGSGCCSVAARSDDQGFVAVGVLGVAGLLVVARRRRSPR